MKKRIILWRSPGTSITTETQLKELKPAALALKLKLEEIETQPDRKGLESAFQTAKNKQVNAIMLQATRPLFLAKESGLAAKYRLPAIYSQREFVDEGGLCAARIELNSPPVQLKSLCRSL